MRRAAGGSWPAIREANVGGFVLPFANARRRHEFKVLGKLPLADDQIIVAGVIDTLTTSSSTRRSSPIGWSVSRP